MILQNLHMWIIEGPLVWLSTGVGLALLKALAILNLLDLVLHPSKLLCQVSILLSLSVLPLSFASVVLLHQLP